MECEHAQAHASSLIAFSFLLRETLLIVYHFHCSLLKLLETIKDGVFRVGTSVQSEAANFNLNLTADSFTHKLE